MKHKVILKALKPVRALNFVRLGACMVVAFGLSATALASCGDSLSAMATAATAIVARSGPMQQDFQTSVDDTVNSSIVGLWHVRFEVGGQTIQEAYQIWNTGGTEVHNPNVDPRTGSVCLGAWKLSPSGIYKLAHRVWSYDANGNFLGTIQLSEELALGQDGNSHGGSFTLGFYGPTGKFLMDVPGNVVGERISVQ